MYGSSVAGAAELYQTIGQSLAGSRTSWRIAVKSDREVRREDLGGRSLYVVGTSRSNRWIREMAAHLPVAFPAEGFRFHERTYKSPEDVLKLFYPNPYDPRFPLYLVTGNADAYVARHADWNRRGDFQILRGRRTVAMGDFEDVTSSSEEPWSIDPSSFRAFEASEMPSRITKHFAYFVQGNGPDGEALRALAEANEALHGRVVAFLGDEAPTGGRIAVDVYSTHEEKGLVTGSTSSAD